jgi:Arsenical resistance operon protein ArsD
MTTITIYDPPMCCSTGVCGPEVDQELVNFAADIDWLKSKGIAVTRINLSQEPAEFATNTDVKSVLETSGVEGLPVIMLEGGLHSSGRYPKRAELAQLAGIEYAAEAIEAEPLSKKTGCCGGAEEAEETQSGCC